MTPHTYMYGTYQVNVLVLVEMGAFIITIFIEIKYFIINKYLNNIIYCSPLHLTLDIIVLNKLYTMWYLIIII